MEKLFFDRLVELKDDAIDFIYSKVAPNGVSGNINVKINPDNKFLIDRIECDSGGLFIRLNSEPVNIIDISREKVIMIAAYLDKSWDGL